MAESPGAAAQPPPIGARTAIVKPGAKREDGRGEPGDKPLARAGSRLFLNQDASPDVMEFHPAEARARREAGKAALRVCADPSGAMLGEPNVLKSSGHDRLDVAARRWAQAAKWVPATVNQRSVEGCTEVSAAFRP